MKKTITSVFWTSYILYAILLYLIAASNEAMLRNLEADVARQNRDIFETTHR